MTDTTFPLLDAMRDGVSAYDLGVIGEAQYAIDTVRVGRRRFSGNIWRRAASHVGTYGGWRWESSSKHPFVHRSVALNAALASRIEALKLAVVVGDVDWLHRFTVRSHLTLRPLEPDDATDDQRPLAAGDVGLPARDANV